MEQSGSFEHRSTTKKKVLGNVEKALNVLASCGEDVSLARQELEQLRKKRIELAKKQFYQCHALLMLMNEK